MSQSLTLLLILSAPRKFDQKGGFYRDAKSDFGMEKVNYPENTLFYANQAYLTVQKGKNVLYTDHFILGRVIPAANVTTEVDRYKCGPDEVKII